MYEGYDYIDVPPNLKTAVEDALKMIKSGTVPGYAIVTAAKNNKVSSKDVAHWVGKLARQKRKVINYKTDYYKKISTACKEGNERLAKGEKDKVSVADKPVADRELVPQTALSLEFKQISIFGS